MLISLRNVFAAILLSAAGITAIFYGAACAQNVPGGTQTDNSGLNGSMSHDDLEKLGGDHKQDTATGNSKNTKIKEQAEALAKESQLTCDVRSAQLVVTGTRQLVPGGKEVKTNVYEVACYGRLGYLLETQGADKPMSISCLAAEEARAADVAKGKPPGFFCKLPENRDVYAFVTALIKEGTGMTCAVRDLKLFGRSESTKSDYSEVACKDGAGFLLQIPQPGSQVETTVMSCADAAKRGIKCRLTDAGPVSTPITTDTLKNALVQHGVTCKIDQIRFIGQEDNLKRYVVEYLCANQSTGQVAFLPLEGNKNPYNAMDCRMAIKNSILCELAPAK